MCILLIALFCVVDVSNCAMRPGFITQEFNIPKTYLSRDAKYLLPNMQDNFKKPTFPIFWRNLNMTSIAGVPPTNMTVSTTPSTTATFKSILPEKTTVLTMAAMATTTSMATSTTTISTMPETNITSNVTAQNHTESATETEHRPETEPPPDITARPSFTPIHPLDYTAHMNYSTTATTLNLIFQVPPKVHTEPTPSPFHQAMESFMEQQQAGYFTTFLIKLFEFVALKPRDQCNNLNKAFVQEMKRQMPDQRMSFMGSVVHDAMDQILRKQQQVEGDVVRSLAVEIRSALLYRKILLSPELLDVLAYTDSLYTRDEAADNLFSVLEDVKNFPQDVNKTAQEISRDCIAAVVLPIAALGQTDLGKVKQHTLINHVEKLLSTYEKSLGIALKSRRHLGFHTAMNDVKRVLKSLNKFIHKRYSDKIQRSRHHHRQPEKKEHSHKSKPRKDEQNMRIKERHEHGNLRQKELKRQKHYKRHHIDRNTNRHHNKTKLKKEPKRQQDDLVRKNQNPKRREKKVRDKSKKKSKSKIVGLEIESNIKEQQDEMTTLVQKRFNVVNSKNLARIVAVNNAKNESNTNDSNDYVLKDAPTKMYFRANQNKIIRKITVPSSVSDEQNELVANLYDALYHGNKTVRRNSRRLGYDAESNTDTDDEALLKNYIYKHFGYNPDTGIKDLSV